jgi:hypothetical protein
MCQRSVEQLIGRLVTDEGFRKRFAADRDGTLEELIARGMELNGCERRALGTLDLDRVARFAEEIDPRIQKVDLPGHFSKTPHPPSEN